DLAETNKKRQQLSHVKPFLTSKVAAELSREIAFELYHARTSETHNAEDITTLRKGEKPSWEFTTVAITEIHGNIYISASIFSTVTSNNEGADFGLDEVDMAIASKVVKSAHQTSGFKREIYFVKQHSSPTNSVESRGAHAEAQLINEIKLNQKPGDKFVLGVNKPLCDMCADAVPARIAEGIEHVEVGYIDKDGNTVTKSLSGLRKEWDPSKRVDPAYRRPENIKIKVHEDIFKGENNIFDRRYANKCPDCEALYGLTGFKGEREKAKNTKF
ncbi:Glycine dehydrogenase (decarboxylating), partial [Folsomia candida]